MAAIRSIIHSIVRSIVRSKKTQNILLVLLSAMFTLSNPAQAQLAEIKAPLFAEASQALREANQARGALLAPTAYGEAAELYRRADKTLKDNGNLDSIRRDLSKATKLFTKSAASAALADVAFGGTLRGRADAENAEASSYAPKEWQSAEEKFAVATSSMERGRKRAAERNAEAALELYRQAELAAIKANYLNETKTLLEEADERRADRWAPKSFAQASEWVTEAETALTEDRYDTDRPRSLAQQAKHSANHAIYVSKLADDIDDGDTGLEAILLDWEASIQRLADQVDTPVHFDTGQEQAIASIQNAVVNLQSQVTQLSNGITDRDEQINALNAQLADLQKQLGSKSQAAEQLNQVLAQQEQNRQRFASVEALFTLDQANVLRKGNTVIVRMLDLTFDSGSADLKPEHEESLGLLIRAVNEFPGANVVIEGHTDSFGSDATNLDLSQRRADSVENFLANNGIDRGHLTALGYGESQPVANNESAEGRRRNRRIDVVIYPPQ